MMADGAIPAEKDYIKDADLKFNKQKITRNCGQQTPHNAKLLAGLYCEK